MHIHQPLNKILTKGSDDILWKLFDIIDVHELGDMKSHHLQPCLARSIVRGQLLSSTQVWPKDGSLSHTSYRTWGCWHGSNYGRSWARWLVSISWLFDDTSFRTFFLLDFSKDLTATYSIDFFFLPYLMSEITNPMGTHFVDDRVSSFTNLLVDVIVVHILYLNLKRYTNLD